MKKMRQLKESRSNDMKELDSQLSSGQIARSKYYEEKKALNQKTYSVAGAQLTKEFAMKQYAQGLHTPLMFFTVVIRLLLGAFPSLKEHGLGEICWNSNRIEKSGFFYDLANETGRCMSQQLAKDFVKAMSRMHVHSPWAAGDQFHVRIKSVVRKAKSSAEKVHAVSFLLAFSFMTQFRQITNKIIAEFVELEPEAFAARCWELRVVPITNRFGQGRQKAWHKQLLDHAAAGNATLFKSKIVDLYKKLVLSVEVCAAIAAMLAIPADENVSRVSGICGFLNHVTPAGRGDLTQKNLIEAFVAQGQVRLTDDEMKSLPNGSGASKFWSQSGLERSACTEEFRRLITKLKRVVFTDGAGKSHSVTPADLGLLPGNVDEMLLQYWSCAQGRILKIVEGFLRQAHRPVPYSLWPNKQVLEKIRDVFAGNDPNAKKQRKSL